MVWSSSRRVPSAAGAIENVVQPVDLRFEIERMVADEEPGIMGEVGVRHGAVAAVVEMPDRVVAQEIAAGDHAKADIGLAQRGEYPGAVELVLGVEHDGEAEGRALAVLALGD